MGRPTSKAHAARVRGHAKLMHHLRFGILALTVNRILCFVPWPDPDESGRDNGKASERWHGKCCSCLRNVCGFRCQSVTLLRLCL
jgi:hypothetical protein